MRRRSITVLLALLVIVPLAITDTGTTSVCLAGDGGGRVYSGT